MITNLIASVIVTLTTNTTERFPTHREPKPCEPGEQASLGPFTGDSIAFTCWHEVPDANPTNKWVRTTVEEYTHVKFTYKGEPGEFVYKSKVISVTEVEYVLRQEWESKPKVIEGVWHTNYYTLTNWGYIYTNYLDPAEQSNVLYQAEHHLPPMRLTNTITKEKRP